MTEEEKNNLLRTELLEKLKDLDGTEDLFQESDAAFRIKGFHKCILKYPYNKKAITIREYDDSSATSNT